MDCGRIRYAGSVPEVTQRLVSSTVPLGGIFSVGVRLAVLYDAHHERCRSGACDIRPLRVRVFKSSSHACLTVDGVSEAATYGGQRSTVAPTTAANGARRFIVFYAATLEHDHTLTEGSGHQHSG